MIDQVKQALQILDQVAALAPVGREQHVRVQQATQILKQFIDSQVPDEDPPKDEDKAE
jgi:hypothetical protein